MVNEDYNEWNEWLEVDDCGLIQSFLELVDLRVKDIQHLKTNIIRAWYELSKEFADSMVQMSKGNDDE